MAGEQRGSVALRVVEAGAQDGARAVARLAPPDLERIGASVGDIVGIEGKRLTVAKAMRTFVKDTGRGVVELDALTRANAQTRPNDTVTMRRVDCQPAQKIALGAPSGAADGDAKELRRQLHGLPVVVGDRVRVSVSQHRFRDYTVLETSPEGPVFIDLVTNLELKEAQPAGTKKLSYADVGGLGPELTQVREVVELPLKFPELFEKLGIDPPKGVLMHGPPGTGKTLIARAVASESSAHFIHVSGPEIVHRYYGDSEAHLREVFQEARDRAPTIIFFDEVDAIAPKREDVYGEVEKRVVAQLMALMDGLESRGQVLVIAATNIPDSLDPALRRPGRFDREIHVRVPDSDGRLEILRIHAGTMPLGPDVDLERLAEVTHGYVGADLAALCREAAMIALRRAMTGLNFDPEKVSADFLSGLSVSATDFAEGLRSIKPAGVREAYTEVADVKWTDVGGLDEAKRQLQEAIEWPLRYASLFDAAKTSPPKGVILIGPPGSGKTMLAKAVAHESGVNFISVKGPALLSKWVGDSEKGIRDVFHRARLATPCIIFFDEIDALAPRRGGESHDSSNVGDRVVSQLLAEMDGIEELRGVVVLAATNRPDMVDPALLTAGRFESIIELPPPDKAARQAIFTVHTAGKPLARSVNLETLSDLTDGFTGADLAALCRRATMLALRDQVARVGASTQGFEVTAKHFRTALDDMNKIRPRLTTTESEPTPTAAAPTPGQPKANGSKDGKGTPAKPKTERKRAARPKPTPTLLETTS
ncbi:MAG: CDC48 family AAA ATPase [Chloroflexi bacterium]|nr:CDC48 family AAA ATPase [Chloroflexota bacterium]